MRVLELQSVKREDFGLYYRQNYTAIAVLELVKTTVQAPVSFIIETSPLGIKEVTVKVSKETYIEYPMIPVRKSLKAFILEMDSQGKLP
ncbi:MAG: hypothetical protein J1E32_00530 [Treponema sp.]|nr:hypothetical protein [Treponema sp.]